MRILHTSDWHLGKILNGIYLTKDQHEVIMELILTLKEIKPDLIIIAGDIFDRSVPPVDAVELFDEFLYKIVQEARIKLLIIPGNHDNSDRLAFGSRLFTDRGVFIYSRLDSFQSPLVLEDQWGQVCFYPVPFFSPAEIRLLLEREEITTHDQAMGTVIELIRLQFRCSRNVLILHHFVTGGKVTESERPLSVGTLDLISASHFAGFNYTALGHLHAPQEITPGVRYSGSLLKYSFSECDHTKSYTLIEIDQKGALHTETIPIRPRKDLRIIEGFFDEILKSPDNWGNHEDYLLFKLKDTALIFEPMLRLREFFPNTMKIERISRPAGISSAAPSDLHQTDELTVFHDFYQDMMKNAPDNDAMTEVRRVIGELHQDTP